MFKVKPETYVPGFRVGMTDENNGSSLRSLPSFPSGVASGYDPYGTMLQPMVPTVFRPAGLFYQGGNGFPTLNQAYVPVSGGSLAQDPLRQAVDGAANPNANSGGPPVPDPLRQSVDRAANPNINRVPNPLQTILPSDINGQGVGTFVGGLLGAGLGAYVPVPGGPWLGAYVGQHLGRVLGAGTDFTADTMIDAAPLGANPVAP